jgi:nucleotide-binding universal stress UspA family protein
MPAEPAPRLRRILAATDGSPAARVAVERAIELAAAHGASIDLVHAAVEELSRLEPRVYAHEIDGACTPLEAMATERGVTITRHVVPGRASTVIAAQAETLTPDLVVLGARGRTVFDRLLLGSVSDRVIRRVRQPVMIVHPADTRPLDDIRTVVVGIDFSEHTGAVIRAARQMLAPRGGPGTLELVHADAFGADPMVAAAEAETGGGGGATGTTATRAADLRARMNELVASADEDGLSVQAVVASVYPVELLDREVRQVSADVAVVGRSGRGNLERLLLGSVAQRIVEHAACPVIVAGP